MSYTVYVNADRKFTPNNCHYATREEAERAGHELLSRWFVPTGFEVRPTDDAVNYEFPQGHSRPQPITKHCDHCGTTDNHPDEAKDVCPAYEAYVADVQSGAVEPVRRGSFADHAEQFPEVTPEAEGSRGSGRPSAAS